MSTEIEWTDETWNPTVGCSRVSDGCTNCYAIRVAGREMQDAHKGLTKFDDSGERRRGLDWTGEVRLLPDRLDTPLRWRKPRPVFVDSMSDLFHPDVDVEFISEVWARMYQAHQHTFQMLTKRPQRMAQVLSEPSFVEHVQLVCEQFYDDPDEIYVQPEPWPPRNVWLGTSVEDQRYADLRIPHLLATPTAVRFLSIEPLLGPVDLRRFLFMEPGSAAILWRGVLADPPTNPKIGWVIVGGESGPGARPTHPERVRSIRDQCVAAGVPFFFKQWGEWAPIDPSAWPTMGRWVDPVDGGTHGAEGPGRALMSKLGKKAAGRELDGRTWDEYPLVSQSEETR